jgi:hypothetical protein
MDLRGEVASTVTRRTVLLCTSVALSSAVYAPITQNYFHADDFLGLYAIVNRSFLRWALAPMAGHLYVARNLLFSGMYELFGPYPEPYFFVVLATHAVNTWLLFRIIAAFTGSVYLACFGATLWGTSPGNEAAIGWYANYGHVAATTILLAVLAQLADRLGDPDALPGSGWPPRWSFPPSCSSVCRRSCAAPRRSGRS